MNAKFVSGGCVAISIVQVRDSFSFQDEDLLFFLRRIKPCPSQVRSWSWLQCTHHEIPFFSSNDRTNETSSNRNHGDGTPSQ